uniref:Uncharacterized protein n=1 Tax=Arundo donax TaxID=35708 RepID=A0A0A9GLA1_ARUDO
MASILLDVV